MLESITIFLMPQEAASRIEAAGRKCRPIDGRYSTILKFLIILMSSCSKL